MAAIREAAQDPFAPGVVQGTPLGRARQIPALGLLEEAVVRPIERIGEPTQAVTVAVFRNVDADLADRAPRKLSRVGSPWPLARSYSASIVVYLFVLVMMSSRLSRVKCHSESSGRLGSLQMRDPGIGTSPW